MVRACWPDADPQGSRARSIVWARLAICFLLLLPLTGCLPVVISTDHDYLLARREGSAWTVVPDDDPLYERFERHVLSDPQVHRLLMLFDHATKALLAVEARTAFSGTIANKPVIVIDSERVGALYDVVLSAGGRRVPIELALGLGQGGEVALADTRHDVYRATAPLLLELMGVPAPADLESIPLDQPTPSALHAGWRAALDTIYGLEHPQWMSQLEGREDAAAQERLWQYRQVPVNGLRVRFKEGIPTGELRPAEEALRTPGVVATFFYRLLSRINTYYPQRHMLWFANFEAQETDHAKVLLAMNRMADRERASVMSFIESYAETFPAEREMVFHLAEEVFGQRPPDG